MNRTFNIPSSIRFLLILSLGALFSSTTLAAPCTPGPIVSSCSQYDWTSGDITILSRITISGGSAFPDFDAMHVNASTQVGTLVVNSGGSIESSSGWGIFAYNLANITSISNDGLISGASNAIANAGTIGLGASYGIYNTGIMTGGISNISVITGSIAGVYNSGTIDFLDSSGGQLATIINSGILGGGGLQYIGLSNTGTALKIYGNSAHVLDDVVLYGTGSSVIIGDNSNTAQFTTEANFGGSGSGTLTYLDNFSVGLGSTLTTHDHLDIYTDIFNNAGTVTVPVGTSATFLHDSSQLINSGTMTGDIGLVNSGLNVIITNSGTISGLGDGINNDYLASITTITNQSTGRILSDVSSAIATNHSDIGSIINDGLIQSNSGGGISNFRSTIGYITNRAGATISSAGMGISNQPEYSSLTPSEITSIINEGTILSTNGTAIYNSWDSNDGVNGIGGIIGNIENRATGSISGDVNGIINIDGSTISSITNAGIIEADTAISNYFGATIGTITNNIGGTIRGGSIGIYNDDAGATISTLTNAGTISANTNGSGISNFNGGTIGIITNESSGTISVSGGYGIDNHATIGTITNAGTISVGSGRGILNAGTINILNNSQGVGNTQGALTYSGTLPTHYNIIINSTSQYGQLAGTIVTGATAFGIYAGSLITSRLYLGVLQGLSDSNVGATRTGTYDGVNWTLAISSGTSWDLTFTGASLVGTQASLHNSAQRMRSIFSTAAISTNFANMNTYDCNLFDTKGMCISAGGRYTTVDNPSSNSSSAVVVVGYKASPNIRIGGFLDQNFNTTTPTGIHIANKNPMMGAFAVWNQNEDHLGYQVKIANAYQDKDVTTTRDVIGLSEAGAGSTKLNTQSYVGELSYAFTFKDKTLVRPYLALRHTTIKQDAYTEDTTVTAPLTYAALEDKTTAALLGIKLNHALTPKANLTASLGIEQDLSHKVDQYAASGVSGLTSENFNDNIKRTRPVASLGAYYAVTKTQRISGDVYYQQLPFQSTGSTTAYFNYMIGL